MKTRWGIDLGGTKIEGIIINAETNQTISRVRVPTEGDKGYHHVLNQIEKLISKLKSESGLYPEKIGMGTPGTLDPKMDQMKNCNTTSLNGKHLQKDIQNLIGVPFTLSNDANCFAIAEVKMGIIADLMPEARVVFGVILGTGVGGGLVVEGNVIGGKQGIGGEWGHNYLDESGGLCYCGKSGCVETIISGPALEKYYTRISGNQLKMKQIVEAFRNDSDPHASKTMSRLFYYFGKAMAVVINIVDPDAIVIGGGVGNIEEIYTLGVAEVGPHIFNNRLDTMFFKPKLGDSAGVFGAAFL